MRRPHFRFSSSLLAAVLLGAGVCRVSVAAAVDPASKDAAVPLPPFMVEEISKGPPWRYAQSLDFEILSRCDDPTTRDLTEMYYRLHRLLSLIVPKNLQVQHDVQKTVIYYDEGLRAAAASNEIIAQMLRNSNALPPPVEDPTGLGGGRGNFRGTPMAARRYTFLPNMRLWDKDSMSVFAIVRSGELDRDAMYLTQDYVAYLLKTRTPTLPTWFIAGVLNIYPELRFRSDSLTLDEGEWISPAETKLLKADPKTARPLLPIAAFLRADVSVNGQSREENLRVWASQAGLFVRWGLDPNGGKRREAFWKFVEAVADGIAPETALQQCMGLDYAAVTEQLTAFLPTAVRKTVTFRPEGSLTMPPVKLRNATEGEIARIKGDWERLEISYVRLRYPEVAEKYVEQARRTLRRAYDHDIRDPQLLAVLGLCECDAGNDAAARPYLEQAAALNVVRPRAWYELARLRLAERLAAPAKDGRLDATQVADVLTPLFTARKQNPPLPEVYEMIADVWQHSAYAPTKAHLGVLLEGVTLFPRRIPLLRRVAELNLAHGNSESAAIMIDVGLRMVSEEADRAYFNSLKARLPATADAK